GPTWTAPGMGTEAVAGSPDFTGGLDVGYSGVDTSQTANLYFGLKIDAFPNGYSMDGGAITGNEMFRFLSTTPNSISYTAETTVQTLPNSIQYLQPTRMTLTFSGLGSMVQDATTLGISGANGDVGALWHVGGDFGVNIFMEAQVVQPGDPNFGNWEPATELFNRLETVGISTGTGSSVDWGFYYEETVVPVPAAAWLFGSGLLGLAGVARRKEMAHRIRP
ncbi:MAG: VPLPA-CTERM sorting domain-containing protein, partial [Thiotrichales bacterium]